MAVRAFYSHSVACVCVVFAYNGACVDACCVVTRSAYAKKGAALGL